MNLTVWWLGLGLIGVDIMLPFLYVSLWVGQTFVQGRLCMYNCTYKSSFSCLLLCYEVYYLTTSDLQHQKWIDVTLTSVLQLSPCKMYNPICVDYVQGAQMCMVWTIFSSGIFSNLLLSWCIEVQFPNSSGRKVTVQKERKGDRKRNILEEETG